MGLPRFHFPEHRKVALQAMTVFYPRFIGPGNNYFISHILINLPFIIQDWVSDIGKEVSQEVVIGVIPYFLRDGGTAIDVQKHKDAFLSAGDVVAPGGNAPEQSGTKLVIDL